MANNTKFNKQETIRTEAAVNCAFKPDLFSTALRIERALAKNRSYVRVRFEYLCKDDPSYVEDDWCSATIDFNEFESLVNYLLYEFNCVKLHDTKPLRARPCFHEVEAIFVKQEG